MNINDLLKVAVEHGASDLHLKVGNPPVIRVDGDLEPLTNLKRLMQEDTIAMALSIMNARQKQRFKEEMEIDISYEVSGLGRFRCDVFQQRGAVGMVLRVIPGTIFSLSELNLPPVLEKICEEQRGLVLCTGTTGSGKSTTLAAMIDHINGTRGEHVVTIEDPIEYLHRDKKSIDQPARDRRRHPFASRPRCAPRCARTPTSSWSARCATTRPSRPRCSPPRPATWCSRRCTPWTPPRPSTASSRSSRRTTRSRSASSSRRCCTAVVSMRLLPRADGIGRVPAVEVMIVTPYIRDCIENKEKTKYIREQIALGTSQYGMQTFDQSLYYALQGGADHARGGAEARLQPRRVPPQDRGRAVHRRRWRASRWSRGSTWGRPRCWSGATSTILLRDARPRPRVRPRHPHGRRPRRAGAVAERPGPARPRGGRTRAPAPSSPATAYAAALDLLGRRAHFGNELARKLVAKGCAAEDVARPSRGCAPPSWSTTAAPRSSSSSRGCAGRRRAGAGCAPSSSARASTRR